jgi:hypothetical protein
MDYNCVYVLAGGGGGAREFAARVHQNVRGGLFPSGFQPEQCPTYVRVVSDARRLPHVRLHLIIIIVIGETSFLEPYPSLEDSARFVHSWELDRPIFTSLGFHNNNFFT